MGTPIATISTPECSIVTSGIYERYLEANDKKYHHIFDDKTGYLVNANLMSVTAFTKDSVEAEVECKKLFFAGKPLKGWLNNPDYYAAVFVYNDDKILFDKV